MSLAAHVATLGRGPGRSRALTLAEAEAAMALMLSGDAAPEAVGALLMLLRMKGETPEEIAGFVQAAQAATDPLPAVDLDWPSYAAGRTRGRPWFLLSARLVAMAGHRVLIHGRNAQDGAVRDHLSEAQIPTAWEPGALDAALTAGGIAYAPLEHLHPALDALLGLRPVLGLRSCVNTVCRMLNPGQARASVQGVFHPTYRQLQTEAAALLGQPALTVIKGGGGEFERHPGKDVHSFGLRGGSPFERVLPAIKRAEARRLAELPAEVTLARLWSGAVADDFAENIVIGTAALALDTLGHAAPETQARRLWSARLDALAA